MLADVLKLLKDASPVIAVLAVSALAIYLWFQDRKDRRSRGVLDSVNEKLGTMGGQVTEVHRMLTEHMARETGAAQLAALESINQQLVIMNATQPGKIVSIENSKLMIASQWEACRNETVRILANSIQNNNFEGNEANIARRVQLAWRQATDQACRPLELMTGLSFPYDKLFSDNLTYIQNHLWSWAVPLYHRDCVDDFRIELEDFCRQARQLFDDVLRAYFDAAMDIDQGLLYARAQADTADSSGTRRTRTEGSGVHVGEDLDLVVAMVEKLRGYRKGTESGSGGHRARIDPTEDVRRNSQTD